jgi:serine/threonine protein kinase
MKILFEANDLVRLGNSANTPHSYLSQSLEEKGKRKKRKSEGLFIFRLFQYFRKKKEGKENQFPALLWLRLFLMKIATIHRLAVVVLGLALLHTIVVSSDAESLSERNPRFEAHILNDVPLFQRGNDEDPSKLAGSLVPIYTFHHNDLLFLGLQDGTVLALQSDDGTELWRLDTGGAMIRTELIQAAPPRNPQHPLAFPLGIRGQWLYPQSDSGTFDAAPFMHLAQLIKTPLHTVDDGTEIVTTTTAKRFDVDDRGLVSTEGGLSISPTSPVVHILRYDIHIHCRKFAVFQWNMTISSLKITVSMPTGPQHSALGYQTELRKHPFKESPDLKRGHLEIDESPTVINFVLGEQVQWSKALVSKPAAAFLWTDESVIPVDLLGTSHRRGSQMALATRNEKHNGNSPADSLYVAPSVPASTSTLANGAPILTPSPTELADPWARTIPGTTGVPPGDSHSHGLDGQWATVSRMLIFMTGSAVAFLVSAMAILSGMIQRRRLQQAWGQLDGLEAALREQQRVNLNQMTNQGFATMSAPATSIPSTSNPPSTRLGPESAVSPFANRKRSVDDTWNGQLGTEDGSLDRETTEDWDLPPPQHKEMPRFPPPAAPTASLLSTHFNLLRRIGIGGGGMVFEARHKLTDITYAIKVIALRGDQERLKREAILHSKLEHKNVVRFFYCWVEDMSSESLSSLHSLIDSMDAEGESTISTVQSSNPGTPTSQSSSYNGDNQKYIFIQMEFFRNGTLAEHLAARPRGGISREENISLLLMIVRGLEYIHSCGIVHRDLKPTNIFMSDDGVAKIGDFGLSYTNTAASRAGELAEPVYANERNETYGVGSPLYSSPEQLETGKATPASDIFAFGVLSFEMYHQFETAHERIQTLQRLREGKIEESVLSAYPEECQLIRKMTAENPKQRIHLKEIHDTLKKLLKSVRSPGMGPTKHEE